MLDVDERLPIVMARRASFIVHKRGVSGFHATVT